jgi:thioredoxin 2
MSDTQLFRCPACGATNRVPQAKLEQKLAPVCGRCKTPLSASTANRKPITVTDASFAAEVESSPIPVLLDMWAAWCGPCHMLAPVIDELAVELTGRVQVGKLNVDENRLTASRFRVQSIPTLLLLKGGKEIARIVGVQPKSEIIRQVEQAIAKAATA